MLFSFKKKAPERAFYDAETVRPVIRVSICTGEEVAGFRNLKTGKFTEDRLIRNSGDLQEFMDCYGISQVPPREY